MVLLIPTPGTDLKIAQQTKEDHSILLARGPADRSIYYYLGLFNATHHALW